ncbi:MAG: PAS domain-containing protein, partial [Rhodospirillales bacterium]|nr:PAS domain-containing protein [Rhodospirillales bacterium]
AEEALKESEVRARAFLNATSEQAALVDLKGAIIDVNSAMATRLGIPMEELIGKDFFDYQTAAKARRWKLHLQQVREFHAPSQFEDQAHGVWYEHNYYPVNAASGQLSHIAIYIRDVTNVKMAGQALRKAKSAAEEASRAKSDFLANMSHELRTPLNAIIGFSDALSQQIFGPLANEKQSEYIENIGQSGELLLDLINDILDVSAIEADKLELREESVDLKIVVDECITLMTTRAGDAKVKILEKFQHNLPKIYGDDRRIRQIFLNLLSNAIKFTPENGKIRITCAVPDDGGIAISFSDTGIGMSDAEVAQALKKFGQVDNEMSRRHAGTGLGLPLTQRLIELHGGTLALHSKPGKGTEVVVAFPADRIHIP